MILPKQKNYLLLVIWKFKMTQLDFNFDKALPPNPYQWGTGNYRVYEWIEKYRQILLSEIHNVLHCETAR